MTDHLICAPPDRVPRRWDPLRPPEEPFDARYFAGAIAALDHRLVRPDLTVVLTWDVDRLPRYGPDVVAVVAGDEAARLPPWSGSVGALFKCYGTTPPLPAGIRLASAGVDVLAWALYARIWGRQIPARLRRTGAHAPVHAIPLGYYNQTEVPLVPFDRRPADVFFAGSLDHDARRSSSRIVTPKKRARTEMLRALGRLHATRPDIRLDVSLTAGFQAVVAEDRARYSRRLCDARICLAPRGNSPETFRLYEGLRAGCVVIADPQPDHWFLRGAPVVEIADWRGLPQLLERLLADPVGLEALHRRSLYWWDKVGGEVALGRWMADTVNGTLAPR